METAVYECTSQEMEENRLTVYYDAFSNSYRMNFFDNDSDLGMGCDKERGFEPGTRNPNFLLCYGSLDEREVLVDLDFSGRSMIVTGILMETINGPEGTEKEEEDIIENLVCHRSVR